MDTVFSSSKIPAILCLRCAPKSHNKGPSGNRSGVGHVPGGFDKASELTDCHFEPPDKEWFRDRYPVSRKLMNKRLGRLSEHAREFFDGRLASHGEFTRWNRDELHSHAIHVSRRSRRRFRARQTIWARPALAGRQLAGRDNTKAQVVGSMNWRRRMSRGGAAFVNRGRVKLRLETPSLRPRPRRLDRQAVIANSTAGHTSRGTTRRHSHACHEGPKRWRRNAPTGAAAT